MFKKKPFFIAFEGIEGSGKSFHSKQLFKKLKKLKLAVEITREPGGSKSAEEIRELILTGKKDKFHSTTDLLLYIASRNEHYINKIKPSLNKKKILICDRFIDSTIAYQSYGYGIKKKIINYLHNLIFRNFKPDLTYLLTVDVNIAIKRIKKRTNNNRYDNLNKSFYRRVQKGFLTIAKKKNNYVILDTKKNSKSTEKIIFSKLLDRINEK